VTVIEASVPSWCVGCASGRCTGLRVVGEAGEAEGVWRWVSGQLSCRWVLVGHLWRWSGAVGAVVVQEKFSTCWGSARNDACQGLSRLSVRSVLCGVELNLAFHGEIVKFGSLL